jgi:ketosteroid isomerase-like protein
MSQKNVEIVCNVLDAFHGSDAEAALAFFDSEVVVDFSLRPDSGITHGVEAFAAMVTDWTATFDDFREETDEIRDLGDRVLAVATQRGRGKGSGVEVEHQYAWLYEFSGDRITRLNGYNSVAEALEAAGLSE